MFDLQKVGHGHGMQFAQLHHSMTNVKIYKYFSHSFPLALTALDIKFQIVYLQEVGQGHWVQFWQWHHSMTIVRMYKRLIFAKKVTETHKNRHTETDKP